MDFLDVLFHHESNEVMVLDLKKFLFINNFKTNFLPNISSIANASRILDAPISPDKHAENTEEIIPMMTNGDQILIFCKNK